MNPRMSRGERGAVAIMVAIMAVLLFGVAALSVDLGNSWSRKRDVQKGVDISAIGAGWGLPMTSANKGEILDAVAGYLNESENLAIAQDSVTGGVGGDLDNDDPDDGEVYFQTKDGTACVSDCVQMKVLSPPATVTFGLANAIGLSSKTVQRIATVRVESSLPPASKLLPFWLPNGCGYGPARAQEDEPGGGGGPSSPTPSPSASPTSTVVPAPTPAVGTYLIGPAGTTYTVGYQQPFTIPANALTASGHNGKKVVVEAFPPAGTNAQSVQLDNETSNAGSGTLVNPMALTTAITGTGGTWHLHLAVKQGNTYSYSTSFVSVNVINAPSPTPTDTPTTPTATATVGESGCGGSEVGNFGQLLSPREGFNEQQAFPRNVAAGLDHKLRPYVFPTGVDEQTTCGQKNQTPEIPLAVYDDEDRPADKIANCLLGGRGGDGAAVYDGLIGGVDDFDGRISVDKGATSPECLAAGRAPTVTGVYQHGEQVNNDVLSCYLTGSHTLSDIAQSTGVSATMLNAAVVKSPRFVWVPVVYSNSRDAGHGQPFQPILRFVPGFITDEGLTSSRGSSTASAANGVPLSGSGGGRSVDYVDVFIFNPAALPPTETVDSTDYDPELGNAIVRLVK